MTCCHYLCLSHISHRLQHYLLLLSYICSKYCLFFFLFFFLCSILIPDGGKASEFNSIIFSLMEIGWWRRVLSGIKLFSLGKFIKLIKSLDSFPYFWSLDGLHSLKITTSLASIMQPYNSVSCKWTTEAQKN